MKKLIIAFVLWIFLTNRSYGQWWFKVKQWDCQPASIKYFKTIITDLSKTEQTKNNKIIKKKVFNKAIINLKKYCNLEKWVPQTPSFINQLLDVAFRKIDSIKWLTYWLPLDPLWKQWRKYLNKISKKNNWKPENIIKNFKKIRWNAEQNIKANNTTLYWKYLLACNEISNIYGYLLINKENINNNIELINNIFKSTCQQMAKERYLREMTLIQKITFINFYTDINKKLFENFSKHTEEQTSFSDKLMKLYDKFTIWLWDFQYLVLRFVRVLDANWW